MLKDIIKSLDMSIVLLILTFTALYFDPMAHASSANSWNFKVYLGDKPIGSHSFRVDQHNQQSHVTGYARFNVKFLGFTAYTYQHNNTESWQGNCLKTIQATTNDNGEALKINGRKTANNKGFHVHTQDTNNIYPTCVKSFAYWNLETMRSPQLLNSQTGELTDTQLRRIGKSKIMARGQEVIANHYRLIGDKLQIDLWYSDDNHWLGLTSYTQDGKTIRYVLQ